jgi:ADP-heptose:LPS heptosyltransferase
VSEPGSEPVSVLVARFLAFGDVLLTLPLAETLHRSRAVASVDVLTQRRYADLLVRSPYVRRVHTSDPGVPYDVLLDLHTRAAPLRADIEALLGRVRAGTRIGFANPWQRTADGRLPTRRWDEHAVEYYARAAGDLIDGPLATGVVTIAPSDLAAARDLVPPGAVAVAPGARYRFKRWPADAYRRLVQLLAARGVPAVLVGHSFDRDVIGQVGGAPVLVIDDDYRLAAVLRACGVVVANNSGMAHLAQVAGARVVCVHSHTLPAMWRPWGDGHVNVTGAPGPCDCPDLTEFETPVPCGLAIEPATVVDSVVELVR